MVGIRRKQPLYRCTSRIGRRCRALVVAVGLGLFAGAALAEEGSGFPSWKAPSDALFSLAGAGRFDPDAGGGEIGGEKYINDWSSAHAGLAFLFADGFDEEFFLGVNLGARIAVPWWLSPFAGVGVYGGWSELEILAALFSDDPGAPDDQRVVETDEGSLLGAIFPEIGVHLWVTDNLRITGLARYYVTTEGRALDYWYYGGGIAISTD